MCPKKDSPADFARSRGRKYHSSRAARTVVSLISLILIAGSLLPASADAGVLSAIIASLKGKQQENTVSGAGNLQTMVLLKPAMNIDPSGGTGGGDITIVDDSALLPEEGPAGTIADIVKPKNGTISIHVVREGDTVSSIAKLFKVSPGTIRAANNLSTNTLQVGQKLVILPITSVPYTVKKGDTLAGIAKRYGADATEIANYNGVDDGTLIIGDEILIPGGEVPAAAVSKPKSKGIGAEPAHNVGPQGTATQIGYYLRPIVGGIKTQGIHGYNGVDLGAPVGTPILASATGDVIIAKAGGYNGGYGSYVVIQHGNGAQTLYAHMSKVAVNDGERVVQGQIIGYVGSTGKSTGAHVHFEIRNDIKNPF